MLMLNELSRMGVHLQLWAQSTYILRGMNNHVAIDLNFTTPLKFVDQQTTKK